MRAIAISVLGLGACGSSDPLVLEHRFPDVTFAAGEERSGFCQSWTLGNSSPVNVNSVELAAGPGWHHSNWFYVPDSEYDGPDGVWDCDERGFDGAAAALVGGVLYAQSTQVTNEAQRFPPGAVVTLPPYARLVGDSHALNASSASVTTSLTLTLGDLPDDEVTVRLHGLGLEYLPLAIPPASRATFTTECDLAGAHDNQLGRPLDLSLYYVLMHYHALGTGARVEALRGDGEADVVFETGDSIGHTLGQTLDPPYPTWGTTGLRFSCRFDNPGDASVGWGIGDQEMCMLLAFTDSELVWGGGNINGNSVVGTAEDGTILNEGPCTIVGVAPAEW